MLGIQIQESLQSNIYRAGRHKALILFKAAVISVLSSVIGAGFFLWRDNGVVDIIRHWLNWNRCYADGVLVLTVCARLCGMLGIYSRYPSLKVFLLHLLIHMVLNTLLPGYLLSLLLPDLCQRHFTTVTSEQGIETQVEIGVRFADQLRLLFATVGLYFITSVIFNTPIQMLVRNGKSSCRNAVDYLKTTFAFSLILGLWSSLVIVVIGVGALQMSTQMEVFVFGYLFPVVKAFVVRFTAIFANFIDALNRNGASNNEVNVGTSIITLSISGASLACGMAQLYVIYMTSSNYALFALQYIPHEVIKKASWGTFLRCFRKARLTQTKKLSHQTNGLVTVATRRSNKVGAVEVRKPDAVSIGGGTPAMSRKVSLVTMDQVKEGDKAVAEEIVGREFGEDVCMFIAGAAVTPFLQGLSFFHGTSAIGQADGSMTAPRYVDLAVCIVGIVFVLENVLTVIVLAGLMRDGIPISHQYAPWTSQPRIAAIQILIAVSIMLILDMGLTK